ncbi:hypothetical protein SprV_0100179500 [Sparganum proliferum]
MLEELIGSFEDAIATSVARWDEINMTEDEIRQRASSLPVDSSLQQTILNLIRELSPADRSFSVARSLSGAQFSSYTQARRSLVEGPQLSEKEVIAQSRERRVARDANTVRAVRSLLHSTHRLQVIAAVQHLQQIRDKMHSDRSRELQQLEHARLIARPHVISRQFGLYQSYTCYLCRNVFPSIEFLQAHLLSLKHYRLCLSKERRQVVAWAQDNTKLMATSRAEQQEQEGTVAADATGVETPGILSEPSKKEQEATAKGPVKRTEDQTNGNNNSFVQLFDKTRNVDGAAENANNALTVFGEANNVDDDGRDITNAMKNVVFAEMVDAAQRTKSLRSENPVVLNFGTCLFCGAKTDLSPSVEVHRCTRELTLFIEQEIRYMNKHGSPLACLLCECRVYDSPDALMVHLVGRHCAQSDSNQCTLCGDNFPPSTAKLDPIIRKHILDRHLEQVHLPGLEVVGRLFQSFGDTIAPRPMMQAATNVLGLTRSFRCCFPAGQAAGKGPKFPYEHWYDRRSKVTNDSRPSRDVGTNLATKTPAAQSKGLRRTSREAAHRFCLLNPREYYEKLRVKFERGGGAPSSVFALLSSTVPWCAQTGQLCSMARFVAHIVGVHGGSPMLQPGLRESILEAHMWPEKQKSKLPWVRPCGTLNFQERFSVWNPTRMALQSLQQSVHLGSAPASQKFTTAALIENSVVHLSVAHATLYPLVCGLCHEPLTTQAFAESGVEAELAQVMEPVIEKVDANLRDYVSTHGASAPIDLEQVLPPVDMTATTAAVRHAINAGLSIAIQVEELKAVRSIVRAGEAALRLPAVNLLLAMKAHERLHVEEFRAQYQLQPNVRYGQRDELLREQILCAQKRGLQAGLLLLVDELQDLQAERLDCEQEKLALRDKESRPENSHSGSESITRGERNDDEEEENLPDKPLGITNTLWKHFKQCESLRIKLEAECDE